MKSDAWIDGKTATLEPERLVILDDMLTTGRHFRAMNFVLHRWFPQAQIIGTFITRRVVQEDRSSSTSLRINESANLRTDGVWVCPRRSRALGGKFESRDSRRGLKCDSLGQEVTHGKSCFE